jgi:hypothetical protein
MRLTTLTNPKRKIERQNPFVFFFFTIIIIIFFFIIIIIIFFFTIIIIIFFFLTIIIIIFFFFIFFFFRLFFHFALFLVCFLLGPPTRLLHVSALSLLPLSDRSSLLARGF